MKPASPMAQMTLGLSLLLSTTSVLSGTWIDPTWEQMIHEADVIGLFEVTEGGLNSGKVRSLKILKGDLPDTPIPLVHFNDPHWPMEAQEEHALKKGDQHYLFLSRFWQFRFSDKKADFEANDIDYDWDQFRTDILMVPSPTTGILPVNNDHMVRFSLFSPSYSWTSSPLPKEVLEGFITHSVAFNRSGSPNEEALKEAVNNIATALATNSDENTLNAAFWLGAYRHWGGRELVEPVIQSARHEVAGIRYEACQAIGSALPEPAAKSLLIEFLKDPHPLVQGRAVEFLQELEGDAEIGEIFTAHLSRALPGQLGPANVMSPVRNTQDGGLLALIKALRQMNYREAEDELAAVIVTTKSPEVMKEAALTLSQFGSEAHIEALRHHLQGDDQEMRKETISFLDNLDPIPALFNDLETLMVEASPDGYEICLLMDLMQSEENIPAVAKLVEKLISKESPDVWDDKMCGEAIGLFTRFPQPEHDPLIERIMFYWTGADSHFVRSPQLLDMRRELEQREMQKLSKAISELGGKHPDLDCLVFLENRAELARDPGLTPQYHFRCSALFRLDEDGKSVTPNFNPLERRKEIAEAAQIPHEHLGIRQQTGISSWNVSNDDDRLHEAYGSELFRAYINYAEALPTPHKTELLEFYLRTGIAEAMQSEKIVSNFLNPDEE